VVEVKARWHRPFMRPARRLGYPLRLAALRLSRRASTALLAAVGVAAGAAMLAAVLAGSTVARDERVGRDIGQIPAADRSVRADWFGLPAQAREDWPTLDRRARRALLGVGAGEPASLVLFRESSLAGRFIGLGAVDGLRDWVVLRSGRLPQQCRPERCEVVRLRGEGRLPSAPGLRLVEVGEAALRSPVLFGDFLAPAENERSRAALSPLYREAAAYHRPPPAPLVLAEGVAPLTRSTVLENVYRSYSWVVPLRQGSVHAWELDRLDGAVARARSSLQSASAGFALAAPLDEVREAGVESKVAGRRLLLIGGEAAALLFAFAVLAAVGMRRDVDAARQRLTWYGARDWQLSVLVAAETGLIALVGTAAGWALGSLAAWLVADRAGAPAGAVLSHSTFSSRGLLVALATAVALALVLLAALRLRPVALGGRSFSPLDAAALGALVAIAVLLARGDFDETSLAGGEGSAAVLVLLPGLVTFVAAVVFARLFRPALFALERLARRRHVSFRLAALSLARNPGHAAVAIAFLVVSVGLAVFAESYRTTLARGQEQEASFRVPFDFVVREDLTRLIPVREAAPPQRLAALGPDVRVEPVLRLSANVSRAGGATGITALGLDPEALPALGGWRDDFAARSPAQLASGIESGAEPRGPVLPEDSTELVVDGRGRSITLTASVATPSGAFATLELGETEPLGHLLRAPIPKEARGGRLVALTLVPPRIVERGGDQGEPFEGTLVLGPLRAETEGSGSVTLGGYGEWIGVSGVEPAPTGESATLRYTLTEEQTSRFRPRQPSDEGPVPVIASPGVAAAAGEGGRLPLRVAGEQVVARVAGVARRFPGTSGEFVVADRVLLGTALNAERPGIAVSNEVWLGAQSVERRRALEAALARPPFDVLAVESRAALEDSLRNDPLARGTLLTLLGGALVALGLALVGILLGVLSDLRDDRGEFRDLEAQGARPALLRRVVRTRGAVVALAGLLGGIATAAVLSLLVVDLVAVTAEAQAAELPLQPAVDWGVLGGALAGCALLAGVLVAAVARRA
jgi:hypothetical protein